MAENTRLQETHGEAEWTAVKLTEVETECDKLAEECRKLKTLYDGVLEEMQKEQRKAAAESCELEGRIESLCLEQEQAERDAAEWEKRASDLHAEIGAMQEHQELELLHALAEEKASWEAWSIV